MSEVFVCPKCGNDNQMLFDTWNHRREQVDVNCKVCAYSFIHKFAVAKENLLPKEIVKRA